MKALYWSFFSALGWAVLATTFTSTKSLAANSQHVSQLETTGKCVNCDLSGASVGSTFFGADLQGATLKNTNLLYANLVKAKFNNAILEKTDLHSANLAEADLSGAKVTKTNFVGANIYKMQHSPAIKDAVLGNSFDSDQRDSHRSLRNGVTIKDKTIGDRTFCSNLPGKVLACAADRKFRSNFCNKTVKDTSDDVYGYRVSITGIYYS
jgi:hypothetical protein